jgi:hypothetical protein
MAIIKPFRIELSPKIILKTEGKIARAKKPNPNARVRAE